MEDLILNFPQQLTWQPVLENSDKLVRQGGFVVCGMGGSHLAAGLLKIADPKLDLLIHRDYGLPRVPDYFLRDSLIILSSYSGNTEEVLDVAEAGLRAGLQLAVVASGGALLALAQDKGLPHVILPNNLVPRMALGYTFSALCLLTGQTALLGQNQALGGRLRPPEYRAAGERLAQELAGSVPLFYASTANAALAYVWKISVNETAKMPAFWNVLPEQNHNELASFAEPVKNQPFHFVLLSDQSDHARLAKRGEVLQELWRGEGWPVSVINLSGTTPLEKIWNSVVLASWTSLALAKINKVDPVSVPTIEQFKKLICM